MESRRKCLKWIGTASVMSMAGCTGGDGNQDETDSNEDLQDLDEVSLTIASAFESSHISVEAANLFADKAEEKSDGKFTAEVVAGGAYGAEDEISEQVADGVVNGHCGGSFSFYQYAPEYAFFDVPWVLTDYDHLLRIFEADEFQPALDLLKERGNQRQLGSRVYMGKSTITANREVKNVSDIQELDLRLPEIDQWLTTWEALEPNIVPVALDELYSAVQQGLVNATTGGTEQVHSFNLQEVQDYLMLSGQRVATAHVSMNEDFYQGLDETHKDIVNEAAQEATQEADEIALEREQELISELEEGGMTIVEEDQINLGEMFETAAPAVESLFEETWEGDYETWNEI